MKWLFLSALMLSPSVQAAPPVVLDWMIVNDIDLGSSERSILNQALERVEAASNGKVDIGECTGSDCNLVIRITDRKTLERTTEWSELRQQSLSETATYTHLNTEVGEDGIVTIELMWDEMLYQKVDGELIFREDAMNRLIGSLGREIYGTAAYLKRNEEFLSTPQYQYDRELQKSFFIKSKAEAYSQSLKFLKRHLKQLGASINAEEKSQLRSTYLLEQQHLIQYSALRNEGMDSSPELGEVCTFIFNN